MSSRQADVLLVPPGPVSAPPAPPVSSQPSLEWSVPRRRAGVLRRIRWQPVAIVAGVATALLALGYAGLNRLGRAGPATQIQLFTITRRSFPVTLQEKGELKAANVIDVRCELEGKATIISLAPEGNAVRKGDLLVELASDEIDEKIRQGGIDQATAQSLHEAAQKELLILTDSNLSEIGKADLKLWTAQHEVEKYKKGEAVQLRQEKQLALQQAQYVLRRDQVRLTDSEELHKQGYITKIDLENDRFAAVKADIELKNAELALKVLEDYTIPMAVQAKEADVREALKELDRAKKKAEASEAKSRAEVAATRSKLDLTTEKLAKVQDQKLKARLVAPADGLVVYHGDWWDRQDGRMIKTGTQVHEQQTLIDLPDTSSMKVVIRVHEAKTERLKVGLPATVEIEGFTGQQFAGHISKIAVLADSRNWLNPNLKEYETEILLEGSFTQLKPGVTARVEILVTDLTNVLAVPVQSVFGKGGKLYVFVDEEGEVRPVEVKVGLSSNEYVEIKEGVQAGQVVRLAVTDEMKHKLPDENGAGKPERPRPRPLGTQPAGWPPATQPAQPLATMPAGPPATQPAPALTTQPSGSSSGPRARPPGGRSGPRPRR